MKITSIKSIDEGFEVAVDEVLIKSQTGLIETLIEIYTKYRVEPIMLADLNADAVSMAIITETISQIPTVRISVTNELVVAATRDGDTGAEVSEEGRSIFEAIANLVSAHGYAAKWEDAIARGTVMDWLERFQYGAARAAREQLESELESILNPERASW